MKIAVIDFVSSLSDHVFDMLNRIGMDYVVFDHTVTLKDLEGFDALIFTGSHDTVYDGGRQIDPAVLELGLPILGICYGHQLVHYLLGGEVRQSPTPEYDPVLLRVTDSPLFKGLPREQMVAMHHGDEVVKMAEGFEKIGETDGCFYAASQNLEKKIFTLQFHPEAEGNDYGREIFENYFDLI